MGFHYGSEYNKTHKSFFFFSNQRASFPTYMGLFANLSGVSSAKRQEIPMYKMKRYNKNTKYPVKVSAEIDPKPKGAAVSPSNY